MNGLAKVTMLLAQAPWADGGDLRDQIELHVGLDPQGHLDAAGWDADPGSWFAMRRRPDAEPRRGVVMRLDEGWAVRGIRGDDEPLWNLETTLIRPGELVRLRQPDGAFLLFRVVAVEGD